MKKGFSSSARHTSKSSSSESAKNQHGMTLRSAKTDSLNDLCEIIRQRDKRITSLEAQVKRLKAIIAAKDSELEKVLPLVALHREVENTDVATDNTSVEVHEEQNPQDSGDQVNGDVVTTLPVAGRMLSEQNPQNSGEQFNGDVVTTLPVAPDSGRMLFDMPTAETSRRDVYGPEVEHSLGMVRNGTTSPVDISCEAGAKGLKILSQTAAGDSAIEDAADNSFEIYEDPETENVIEEQGLPVGPSRSGRMPLGERECEGTISWNPDMDWDADMDLDADMADQSFEDFPKDAVGKETAKTNSLPSSPTTKPTILGQKYVGATFGSTAATRTAFGGSLLNISPFAALSAAGYNPTTLTASPEPMRSEFSGENDNTLQPQQKSNSVTVLTGEENEKTMHRTEGTLYETENGQWHEQGINFNGENDNTLQPQQEPNSVTVLTGEENEKTMRRTRGTLYAMENSQRREQGIAFRTLGVPVTDEEGAGNRSGRRPTLGYNPTTLTPVPEPTRSERKRKMSEMFPHASGKRFKIFEDP